MRVGIGCSDNPDTIAGGAEAACEALRQAGQDRPCDLVLMFSTSRHEPKTLREAVGRVMGGDVPVVGGGATGIITDGYFGYAGDQIGLAAFWFDRAHCEFLAEGGLFHGEEKRAGAVLGDRLKCAGTLPETPVLLFYDAVDRSRGDLRLATATHLLAGIEKGLGFLPDLVGAGLQGDYVWTPTRQWTGRGVDVHQVLALKFTGEARMDIAVLHGCRPATGYYTVTKADGETILEIDGRPALPHIMNILGPALPPEALGCFLILGINTGDKWAEFDEQCYANHLCLGVDRQRDGLVMFEPDMVAGTEFQIMHRSLDLEYIVPRVSGLFDRLDGRRPAFGFFIDCAGRAAGYGGIDLEDAVYVQKAVAGRVPLLGIYSGVEIAPVLGRPRALDWTGVFCLFSVP